MYKKSILIIGCALFLFGCQSTQNNLAENRTTKDISFISFPPGAVIEVNGTYKGRTPNVVSLKEYHIEEDASPSHYNVFIYPPQEEDYCMQMTALNPYDLPGEISFDLTLCSEDEKPPVLPNGNLGVHPDTQTF